MAGEGDPRRLAPGAAPLHPGRSGEPARFAASEADPDLGFMARLMALCSLPRTNPGNRYRYAPQRPLHLYMSATGLNKLPFGNLPRLLLAWVCTEAVRTQSRELVLGRSLSKFMRTSGDQQRQRREPGGPDPAPQPDEAALSVAPSR